MAKPKNKLAQLKKAYNDYLNKKANNIAWILSSKKNVTKLILDCIGELYEAANLEKNYPENNFEAAYHNPITSDLEFLIARILAYYSKRKHLGWKVYLRKQYKKTAPDIRIEKKRKTIAIIEIKAKVGWMQTVFSKETYKKELKRYKTGAGPDPKELIKRAANQIKKYHKTFKIPPSRIYVLLPALKEAHRKKSKQGVNDYRDFFLKKTGLPKNNLIIMSENLMLSLDGKPKDITARRDYNETRQFEDFVSEISK